MFLRRRVELIEASAEFEAAFMLSAKRRRLPPERIDATRARIRELRENRDQREANMRVLSQEGILFRNVAELFEQARSRLSDCTQIVNLTSNQKMPASIPREFLGP